MALDQDSSLYHTSIEGWIRWMMSWSAYPTQTRGSKAAESLTDGLSESQMRASQTRLLAASRKIGVANGTPLGCC